MQDYQAVVDNVVNNVRVNIKVVFASALFIGVFISLAYFMGNANIITNKLVPNGIMNL